MTPEEETLMDKVIAKGALDLGPIEERLNQYVTNPFFAPGPINEDCLALINEVKRLREENRSMFQDYVELRKWADNSEPDLVIKVSGSEESDRASVRGDALLEAAKVNCQRCKNGDKLVSKQGKYYLHRIDVEGSNDYVDVNCDSEEIHQLIADEQGE
jgi:hypothetical protein